MGAPACRVAAAAARVVASPHNYESREDRIRAAPATAAAPPRASALRGRAGVACVADALGAALKDRKRSRLRSSHLASRFSSTRTTWPTSRQSWKGLARRSRRGVCVRERFLSTRLARSWHTVRRRLVQDEARVARRLPAVRAEGCVLSFRCSTFRQRPAQASSQPRSSTRTSDTRRARFA